MVISSQEGNNYIMHKTEIAKNPDRLEVPAHLCDISTLNLGEYIYLHKGRKNV